MAPEMTAWRVALWAGAAFALVMALVLDARSQGRQFCDTERALLDMLARNFGEWPAWAGTWAGGKFIVTRAGTGSWSLVRVDGQRACITAAGTANRFDKGT